MHSQVRQLGDELVEVAAQALELDADQSVLEFDGRELGGEA